MNNKTKPCLVACSVLRKEIEKLIQKGELDADFIFVSKYFHVDYAQIEKNLRPTIEKALERYPENVILVYGDLCLGMDDEMKKLADEYGIVKIDALNCIDCQLGGKGKSAKVDPHGDFMFFSEGMTDFFRHGKEEMKKEGIENSSFKQFFSGIRGILLLDTLDNEDQLRDEVEKLDTDLKILETKHLGCGHVKNVIQEAIDKNKEIHKKID